MDRRATETRELRTALLGVALFAAVVLVNAILAIAFIALMQALGLWAFAAAETALSSPEAADELRTSALLPAHVEVLGCSRDELPSFAFLPREADAPSESLDALAGF